jgi:hypothetical protein
VDPFIGIFPKLSAEQVYRHEALMPRAAYHRTELFNDFMCPTKEDPGLLCLVRAGSPETRVTLSLQTPLGTRPTPTRVAACKVIGPHIARALTSSDERRGLRIQRDALLQMRGHEPYAVRLVQRCGRVINATANTAEILQRVAGLRLTEQRIELADPALAERYRRGLHAERRTPSRSSSPPHTRMRLVSHAGEAVELRLYSVASLSDCMPPAPSS